MEDNLITIMFCEALQTFVRRIKDYAQINIIKDRNEDQNADKQEVIHCGGTPASGWCDECEYGFINKKGYREILSEEIEDE